MVNYGLLKKQLKQVKNWAYRLWASALKMAGTHMPFLKKRKTSNTGSLYPYLHNLPFSVFKECCVHQAYHLLGDGEQEEHWLELYSEFCRLSKDDNVAALVAQMSQMDYLQSRIMRVRLIAGLLQQEYSQALSDAMADMELDFDYKDPAAFIAVENNLKNYERELEQLKTNMQQQMSGGEQDNPYASFTRNIRAIETVFKVPVDQDKLMADMYAIMLADLKDYVEKQQRENG